MAVIVTTDIPGVLTQLAERQDEQAAAIELLTEQLADQSIRTEQQDEALRTQAAALRVTAAQLSKNVSDVAKAANGGNGASGNRSTNQRPNRAADDDGGDDDTSDDGADGDGSSNVRRFDRRSSPGNPSGKPVKPLSAGASKPAEPTAPERRRAHRWI